MIAVDTNILVHAHRLASPWHERAAARVRELAEGGGAWAIPWPCVHELLSILTNPKVFAPPADTKTALAFVQELARSPSLVFLSEGDDHLELLAGLMSAGHVTGGKVHDARIAAICLSHGVSELWTADRDFSRFPELAVRNPLVS